MLISVVSPVYNCTGCLEEIVSRVREAFADSEIDWEIIFVDDRGPGNPWPVIATLAQQDARVTGVRLMSNHGQHLAIWAGFAIAKGDWVAVIDCDLQDDPAELKNLYDDAKRGGADAIIVDRGTWSDSVWRRTASRVFYDLLAGITGFRLDGNAGNFGLYSRRMVRNLLAFHDKEVFLPVMAIMTGLERRTHMIPRSGRLEGRSSYNLKQLSRFAIALIIRFSDRPLKLSVLAGMALSGFSAFLGIVVFITWLSGGIRVQGWASIILSIWFVGGLILSALGVHGFYIGRVFTEVQRRPRIRVLETTLGSHPTCEDI